MQRLSTRTMVSGRSMTLPTAHRRQMLLYGSLGLRASIAIGACSRLYAAGHVHPSRLGMAVVGMLVGWVGAGKWPVTG